VKLCRFNDDRLGLVEGESVRDVSAALDLLPPARWPLPLGDPLVANLGTLRPEIERIAPDCPARALDEVRLLSPVANPGKVIGAPVNYYKHLEESQADAEIHHGREIKTIDEYGLFLKANGSLVGAGEGVALRFTDRRNDHEAEVAVVIGKSGDRIPEDAAMDYVAGYAIGLDMTVRGTEDRSLRKSIDSYAVLGPWLVTADEIADHADIDFRLTVNGELRQQANTRYLIFSIPRLIAYASSFYTLHPGDVIMTGTPEGVGPVVPGDVMEVWADGLGTMRVDVR
jgi:2-keto-4-pentenoate hydratase/2-oxohepta-3-ene-1,7-dioic acid hydratase in catechol pathway